MCISLKIILEASTGGMKRWSVHKDALASKASTFCTVCPRCAKRCLQCHQSGALLEGTWDPQGSAERRGNLRDRTADAAGQEAETRWAGARNWQSLARPTHRSSVAAMTAARFEHAHAFPRTHARLRLSRCQRLPGNWCGFGAFTSAPLRGNCGYGSLRSDTRDPEAGKVLEGTVWSVRHFVNVSWMFNVWFTFTNC